MLHRSRQVLLGFAFTTAPRRFPFLAAAFPSNPTRPFHRTQPFPSFTGPTRSFSTKNKLELDMSYIGVSDAFDGGNIEFVEYSAHEELEGHATVVLRIKPDPFTELENKEHSQTFCFRSTISGITEANPLNVKYIIENASETSYPAAWKDYTVCCSSTDLYDESSWERKLDTKYENGKLTWTHTHDTNGNMFFSYFPPYSYERHLKLISKCAIAPSARYMSLGQSLDGREMECISVGSGERICWIIHRQHPGESMASFFAEGLLERLLGLKTNFIVDGMVTRLLSDYTFYIVPNMCPDGAVAGHLRVNACGANLNREWAPSGQPGEDDYYEAPTLERSPEIYSVLQKMDETNVDVFLDIHGDEYLPFCFLAGLEGMPNWGPRLQSLQGAFVAAYTRTNSDMQQEIGYDPEPPGQGTANAGSNQVGLLFDCLALTLEMPFKDCLSNPDPVRGWNPNRAKMLGASVLEPLAHVHPYLRAEGSFWENFPAADEYVVPTSKFAQAPSSHS